MVNATGVNGVGVMFDRHWIAHTERLEIWDSTGALVAQFRQLALLP